MANVLIVEDDRLLRNAFSMIVKSGGYTVGTAENGNEALKQLADFSPDLILLDMLMPVKTGLDFLKESDLKESHPRITVIIVSNLSDPEDIKEALKLGADKYILKSNISPGDLLKELGRYLN